MTLHPYLTLLSLSLGVAACAHRQSHDPSRPSRPMPDVADAGSKAAPSGTATAKKRSPGAVDVNGDGLADIVVSESGEGDRILVWLGSAGLVADPPTQTIALADLGRDGSLQDLLHPGDVDKDGYSDVVVVTHSGAGLLRGGPHGLATKLTSRIATPDGEQNGVKFLPAGDLNDDGHADLLASVTCIPIVLESFPPREIKCRSSDHHFYTWLGRPDGFAAAPSTVEHFPSTHDRIVAAAGDFDGDGYDDVVRQRDGVVRIHRGGAAGLSASPSGELRPPKGKRFVADAVQAIGDVDGDGRSDLIAFAWGERSGSVDRAFVYQGAAISDSVRPAKVLAPPHHGYFHLGMQAAAAIGDIDGDGYDDVAIGDFDRIAIYRGGADGLASKPAFAVSEPKGAQNFGTAVGSGDIDGDGRADLWAAAPASGWPLKGDFIGRVYVWGGDAPTGDPRATLVGSAGKHGDVALWFAGRAPR